MAKQQPIEWVPWGERGVGSKRRGAHSWGFYKRFKWAVCLRCGLIALRNAATRAAERQSCEWWDE